MKRFIYCTQYKFDGANTFIVKAESNEDGLRMLSHCKNDIETTGICYQRTVAFQEHGKVISTAKNKKITPVAVYEINYQDGTKTIYTFWGSFVSKQWRQLGFPSYALNRHKKGDFKNL